MEVIPDHVARALKFLLVLSDRGVRLSAEELDVYATSRAPSGPVRVSSLQVAASNFMGPHIDRPPERVAEYLTEIGLVDTRNRQLQVTPAGRAVLSHLEGVEEEERDRPMKVITLEPDSEWVNYESFMPLREAGEGFLMDPWVDGDVLVSLAKNTQLRRVLTASRPPAKTGIPLVLADITRQGSGMRIEVREVDQDALHDRALVHDDGRITVLGTSINGLGRKFSVAVELPSAIAADYKAKLEQLWQSATVVEPSRVVRDFKRS